MALASADMRQHGAYFPGRPDLFTLRIKLIITAIVHICSVLRPDVSHAADSVLRAGDRPAIEKIRSNLGRGSPNTINPMLDAWWKTLSARLDAGPAALHRLPENVAHIAEALWMQALDEGKRRASLEQRDSARVTELDKQRPRAPLPRPHALRRRTRLTPARSRPHHRNVEFAPTRTHRPAPQGASHTRAVIATGYGAECRRTPERGPELRRGVRREAPNNAELQYVRTPIGERCGQ
jgi:hypothetical protein